MASHPLLQKHKRGNKGGGSHGPRRVHGGGGHDTSTAGAAVAIVMSMAEAVAVEAVAMVVFRADWSWFTTRPKRTRPWRVH